MHSRSAQNVDTSNSDSMDHNERILVAIANSNLQGVSDYGATVKKYDIVYKILMIGHMLQTVSRNKALTKF